jgi:rSAM/selenodomain-associated transferase 1
LNATRIVIFAKAPVAGYAKTRLIPVLGAEKSAHLARRMLLHTAQEALAAGVGPVELCVTPSPSDAAWQGLRSLEGVEWTEQAAGDLGARMADAARRAVALGEPVLLIGTDCPQLDAVQLRWAAQQLHDHDAVLYPTGDGGYALLGLRRFDARLFEQIPWSTSEVADRTVERVRELGWSLAVGEMLHDIDEPADLRWLPEDWRSGYLASEADPRAIDALYGLEPVYEPGLAGEGSGGPLQSITVSCPYCGESFETTVDVSAGSFSYVEDCQVCCQPIVMTGEVDEGSGALSSFTAERG